MHPPGAPRHAAVSTSAGGRSAYRPCRFRHAGSAAQLFTTGKIKRVIFESRSSSGPNLASSARKRASMSYGGYSRAGHAAGRAMGGRSPGRPSQGTKFTARRRGTSTAISAGASSTSTVWRLVSTPYGTQHDRGLGRNSGCAASRLLPAARLKENRQRNGAGSDTGNINYTRG